MKKEDVLLRQCATHTELCQKTGTALNSGWAVRLMVGKGREITTLPVIVGSVSLPYTLFTAPSSSPPSLSIALNLALTHQAGILQTAICFFSELKLRYVVKPVTRPFGFCGC